MNKFHILCSGEKRGTRPKHGAGRVSDELARAQAAQGDRRAARRVAELEQWLDEHEEARMRIDLKQGVVPISKASASIAALLRRSKQEQGPIIVTQKGYPAAVLLDIDVYLRLIQQAGAARPSAEGG